MNASHIIQSIIDGLSAFKVAKLKDSPFYRFFIIFKKLESLFPNKTEIAAAIGRTLHEVPEDVSDEDLTKLANAANDFYNDFYAALVEDLGKEEAEQAFKSLSSI